MTGSLARARTRRASSRSGNVTTDRFLFGQIPVGVADYRHDRLAPSTADAVVIIPFGGSETLAADTMSSSRLVKKYEDRIEKMAATYEDKIRQLQQGLSHYQREVWELETKLGELTERLDSFQRSAAAQAIQGPYANTPRSRLERKLREFLKFMKLDEEAQPVARQALADATALVPTFPDFSPSVLLSDDGIVTLQWRASTDRGVALVFAGDGTATYAAKTQGGSYAGNNKEFVIAGGLPDEARSAIETLITG